ncbi:hypothetical protein MPER_13083, partial [Moniliophthora perniciosa FA553]
MTASLKPNEFGHATVDTSSSRDAPRISSGTFTIKNVKQLETSCTAWLRIRKSGIDVDTATGLASELHLGWSANTPFLDWYLANAADLESLTLSAFFDRARERFLGTTWDYDHAKTIGAEPHKSPESFIDFADRIISSNTYLKGRTPFLSDAALCQRLQMTMADHLKNALGRKDERTKDIVALGHRLVNGAAVVEKGETLRKWILNIEDLDHDYHSRLDDFKRYTNEGAKTLAEIDQRGTKRSTDVAGIGKSSIPVAAAPRWDGGRKTGPPVLPSASQWAPPGAPQTSVNTMTNTHSFPPKIIPEEHDILNFTMGCNNCRLPFQTHRAVPRGQTPHCPSVSGDNYVVRDINFVHDFYQRHPNGFDSSGRNMVMSLRPWPEFFDAFRSRFPQHASKLRARVAAVAVPYGYVAQVSRRESFPPRNFSLASSSVVGTHDDDSFEKDYDTSLDNSPPARYVKSKPAPPSPLLALPPSRDAVRSATAPPAGPSRLLAAATITGEINGDPPVPKMTPSASVEDDVDPDDN